MKQWVDGLAIEDHLGPAAGRFFGDGYRRVRHHLGGAEVVPGERGHLEVRVHGSLSYPADWSVKGEASVPPHLSTVDAFLMAAEASELLLVHLYGIDPTQRAEAWIRSVEFRAGAAPQEDLADFPVSASIEVTRPCEGCLSAAFLSVIAARVGTVKVRLQIEHDIAAVLPQVATIGDPEEILGSAATRFASSGYATRHQVIDDVRRYGQDVVGARIRIEGWEKDRDLAPDLSAAYRPSVAIVDAMAAQPQLAQALLYHLDGFERDESHTLWMRRASVSMATPYRPVEGAFTASAGITKTALTPMGGALFRTSEFAGVFQGIACRFSLAHQLPERVARELATTATQKG